MAKKEPEQRIMYIWRSLDEKVHRLIKPDRFYVALYDVEKSELAFPWVVQDQEKVDWEARPYQHDRLPDYLMERKSPWLVEKEIADQLDAAGVVYGPDGQRPESWLGTPLVFEDRVLGALVVESWVPQAFGERGVRVLATMARQTATAIENARLYDRLNRKIKDLDAVNQIGQELTAGIQLEEEQILNLIHEQASELMDTDNMYIALYDDETDTVRFPLMYVDGEPAHVEARQGGRGRTEWIIRERKPILDRTKEESQAWYREEGRKEYIGEPFASWIGVPMMVRDKVIGVIAAYHKEQDYVYDEHDRLILQSMASQAAIALDNANLVRELKKTREQALEEERKRVEAEKWAYLGKIASSLAHRIGNKGGMVRLCVQDLKKYLNRIGYKDEWIEDQLDTIERNNQYLLSLSDFLFKPRKAMAAGLEESDPLHYLEDALRYAEIPNEVKVECLYPDTLPSVEGNKFLVEVFLEIIENGVSAMQSSKDKTLNIEAEAIGEEVEIRFTDTGSGLPDEEYKIFELFSKQTNRKHRQESGHQGFGLWWVKTFLKELGGDIWYESSRDRGTTFFVRLPTKE